MRHSFGFLAAIFAVAGVAGPSAAQLITFQGKDPGKGPGQSRPVSNATALAYDVVTAELGCPTSIFTLEGLTVGNNPNGTTIGSGVTVFTTNLAGPVLIANTQNVQTGYNTTTGGSKYLKFQTSGFGGSGSMIFNFAPGVSGFGAYFTGVQPNLATVTLSFFDGVTQSFNLSAAIGANAGGVGFFGFLDVGASVASVTITEANNASVRDIFGIDDIRVSYCPQVPEPSVTAFGALASASLLFLILRRCRRA